MSGQQPRPPADTRWVEMEATSSDGKLTRAEKRTAWIALAVFVGFLSLCIGTGIGLGWLLAQ